VAADKFFIFLLTIFLVSLVATALAFAISSRVPVAGVANLLIAMTYVLSMVTESVCYWNFTSYTKMV